MAKKSMIAREVKRKKLVKKYAAKRKSLLDEFNAAKDPMERFKVFQETLHLIELGIDVGLLENQEVFIEILVFAGIS